MAAELTNILDRLHLQDYLPALLENGFDSWHVVCDITEDDLAHLGFKLGHRRVLQREIAAFRGSPHNRSPLGSDAHQRSSPTMTTPDNPSPPPSRQQGRTKRRYRRKPRPDINAPKKPKTAYVNFADNLRTDPQISSLSFVDIAREVGRRWQALPPDQKHVWECQAARDMQEYEAQMDEYKTTENHHRYQNYLKAFNQNQCHGKTPRTGPPPSVDFERQSRDTSSETLSTGSAESISRSPSGSRDSDDCQAAVSLALQELTVRRDQILARGVPLYNAHRLPPQDITRKAAVSCILGTGSLFFLVRESHLEEMLDHVFSQATIEPLPLIIVLLSAAIGAHYDLECMSDTMRQGLFASATLIFCSEFTEADFQAMRIFIMLSIYSLLEKQMVARHVVAAGLQISRTKLRVLEDKAPETVDDEDSKKLVGTLIFMECWLSTTLGYKADVRPEDISRAWSYSVPSTSVTDVIYFQASKIGLVSREITEVTIHKGANAVKTEHIELLTEKLDAWYNALPANMHLTALTDEKHASTLTYYQRRAILMVHMFYLGAIISLYRQLLLNASHARIKSTWDLDMPYAQIQRYRARCSIAAQQMARMMTLIGFNGAMTKRCWLMIYWAFHSCTVVLFSISQQMLDRDPTALDQDFEHAKICVDILKTCSAVEPVAANHLALIQPLYDCLLDKHKRMRYQPSNAVQPIVGREFPASEASPHCRLSPPHDASPALPRMGSEDLDAEVVSIVKKLSDLLADPFSMGLKAKIQGVRESSNAVGTYSVLWWK